MMGLFQEWIGFLLRWLHLMAGIAWIGTSFYFNWFDLSVRPPKDKVLKENIRGTLDEIHGGSFYYHEQYWPDKHPERLLVHSWPAKTTLITGALLLAMIYWHGARTYLIDPSVADIGPLAAIGISFASIAACWFFYNEVCFFFDNNRTVFVIMAVFVSLAAYGFQHVFSGRAAYIHVGAMLRDVHGAQCVDVDRAAPHCDAKGAQCWGAAGQTRRRAGEAAIAAQQLLYVARDVRDDQQPFRGCVQSSPRVGDLVPCDGGWRGHSPLHQCSVQGRAQGQAASHDHRGCILRSAWIEFHQEAGAGRRGAGGYDDGDDDRAKEVHDVSFAKADASDVRGGSVRVRDGYGRSDHGESRENRSAHVGVARHAAR
ncbi:MAG: urate hydroxylase PuuD [Polyangiaceae bacterium]|nr:urate hydroxylase PuuD [Polyangiaceae bacterium]